jgi:uncharacterized protein YndB with AHSA1/START domain
MPVLQISKDFESSKAALYDAWTQPDQLKQWWKPLGKQLVDVQNDIKKGGTVRYQFGSDDLLIDGNYEKVEGNDLLEYTWKWHLKAEPVNDAGYKLSVHFDGDEQHATIHIIQEGFENEESIHPHQHGWEQALEQLQAYLGDREPVLASQNLRPPVSGYNETPEQEKVGGG